MKRRVDFDYKRRLSRGEDKLGLGMNVPWTADVVSIDGAHYHAWFPECEGEMLKRLQADFKYHASWQGDPVSFSYDFLPKEET